MYTKWKLPQFRNVYRSFQNDLLKEEKNIKQIPYKALSRKEEDLLQSLSK